jgi:uncharacterized membrane protein
VTFRFLSPEYLWLILGVIPLIMYAMARLRSVEPGRRMAILILRSLIFLLLILALAQLEYTLRARELTVYFLIDRSDSVPQNLKDSSLEIVAELNRNRPPRDEAGLIVFGSNSSLESLAVPTFEFDGTINSIVDESRTNISTALRLALSALPNDRMNRIVLLSDGNENIDSALETARLARNSNVPIDVLPLRYTQEQDAQIDKIVVPDQAIKDTPFDIKIFLSSETDTRGILRVFEDGEQIVEQEVDIRAGRNAPLVLQRRLQDGTFHRYSATVEVPGDVRVQNNVAEAFTTLKAEPTVLYVEGDLAMEMATTNYLAAALQLEDIRVRVVGPDRIPVSIDELQAYDSIILSNVAAGDMTDHQMRLIERAVHDLGVGLVMVGGENSFGAGGYQDSPIELALPVSMDVKQKRVLPNGALAIILHTCEIPDGNAWAREISLAALRVMSEQDWFGLLYYGSPPATGTQSGFGQGGFGGWGDTWLWDPGMQQVGDKRRMAALINGVQPMDMKDFNSMMQAAYDEVSKIQAQAKHIVVISDADPQAASRALLERIRDSGISVSAVAIAPHNESDIRRMQDMAYIGGGNFYFPKTANELPRIFIKEASIVRRSLIFEEPFFPVSDLPSEVMAGIAALPQLGGYVVTSDKELATVALRTDKDDPLLAHWRYGLGKSVAFTSDAKNKWASQWVDWEGFSKFWSQAVRWSLREVSSSNLQVNTELRGGKGIITVDALDYDGNFRNFLEFETTVLSPTLEPQTVKVRQIGPGRYEGTFDASEVGTYMVSMSTGDGERMETAISGAALSYSPEYEASRSNDAFMERIAEESGGRIVKADYNPFRHDLPPTSRPRPLWPLLLLIGMLLVPVDVFLRRVYVDWGELFGKVTGAVSYAFLFLIGRAPKRKHDADEKLGSLLATKQRVQQDRDKAKEDDAVRREFRKRLDEGTETRPQSQSVFDAPKPGAPPVRRGKETVTPAETTHRPTPGGSLGGLMEAKRRARQKMESDKDEG